MRAIIVGLLNFLLLSGALSAQTPTFEHQSYPAGTAPASPLVLDFNGDGAQDVIVVNSCVVHQYPDCYHSEPTGSVLFGNGDGSFQAPRDLGAYMSTTWGSADFDGDRMADALIDESDEQGLSIIWGNSAANSNYLWAPGIYDVYGAAIIDLNHDGLQDIIYSTANGIFAVQNLGGRQFADPVLVVPSPGDGGAYVNLAVGDFDGDGNADFVTSEQEVNFGKVFVFYGDGHGNFASSYSQSIDGNFYFSVFDYNSDGRSDVVGVQWGCPNGCRSILALTGTSTRTLASRTLIALPADYPVFGGLLVADFNGDGVYDVMAPQSFGEAAYFQGNADGSLQQPIVLGFGNVQGDFDGDARPDGLNTAGTDNGTIELFLNRSTGPSFPKCGPPSPSGINICSPHEGGIYSANVPFSLNTASFTATRKVEVWVDGKKQTEVFRPFLDSALTLAPGAHTATIYQAGYDNDLQRRVVHFTVQANNNCPAPSTSTSINVCSPLANQAYASPVSLVVSGGSSITTIEGWVDGKKLAQVTNSAGGAHLESSLTLAEGTHQLSVFGKIGSSVATKTSYSFVIGSSSGACSAPSSTGGVIICTPQSGATVAASVMVTAKGGSKVSLMEAWIDGVKKETVKGQSLSFAVSLPDGAHRLTVYAKVNGAVSAKATETFTVCSGCRQPRPSRE
jgi:hypothetical protein